MADVMTNAVNGNTDVKSGAAVVHLNKINGIVSSHEGKIESSIYSSIEARLTDKNDDVDYYEIPEAISGGGFTPTPTITPTVTPTLGGASPTPTLTYTPTPTPTPSSTPA